LPHAGPGAIEHAYEAQGSYDITATSVISVSFTIPGGIQTRVDSTS
jgi:hypothetical protein